MMKKPFLFLLLILTPTLMVAQDLIILRNGDDFFCKVEKLDKDEVTYQIDGESEILPVSQIYLIKYESRGNAFFNEFGEVTYSTRVAKVSKKDILIYLCSGGEVRASELEITAESLQYLEPKTSPSKKGVEEWLSIPKEDVFLIRYPDGTKDVVNNLQAVEEQVSAEELPQCKHPFIPINKDAGYPVVADLVLNNGDEKTIIIYDSDRTYIHYRTKEWQDGPIFRMSRSKIKIIKTK